MEESTLAGNRATARGGALFVDGGGALTLRYSTVRGNEAQAHGGGLHVQRGVAFLADETLLIDNTVGRDRTG